KKTMNVATWPTSHGQRRRSGTSAAEAASSARRRLPPSSTVAVITAVAKGITMPACARIRAHQRCESATGGIGSTLAAGKANSARRSPPARARQACGPMEAGFARTAPTPLAETEFTTRSSHSECTAGGCTASGGRHVEDSVLALVIVGARPSEDAADQNQE